MKNKILCATRADVAKRAGVSVTVVSYVVNNNRYVEKSKRERVLKAMEELHYQPNTIARALKGKSSKHIMFIADQVTNDYFSELIKLMDKYAYEKGYLISLCANRNTEDFIREIISRRFDGILISSISFPEKIIQQIIDVGIPVVLLRSRELHNITSAGIIDTGVYQGARECVRVLYQKGRRHIIYLDRISARKHFSTMQDYHLRGFAEQLKEFGLSHENHVITGCGTDEELGQKLKEYLKKNQVDAIFGRNDRLACIGLKTAMSLGYQVPKDIAVVGYDNSVLSKYIIPSLTTFEMQKEEIAKTAVEMIQNMHSDGLVPEPVSFLPRYIEREST